LTAARRLILPVIGRHLVREFARTFALTLAAFVAIYVLADFFDRFDSYLRHDAPVGAIVRSFLFKLPLIVTQVTPVAVLAGALVGLGLLARHNEFVALRACGVSRWQLATPLLVLAAAISAGAFAWNETVVPYCARRWHEIENVEIRRREAASIFTGRDVWYRGKAGFYNISRMQRRRRTLQGLTVYQVNADFRPVRVIEAAAAVWTGRGWRLDAPRTREFRADGSRTYDGAPRGFTLPESITDFEVASVEPEQFSYRMLRRQIRGLKARGVDVSESWVDLHLKLALPVGSLIMMLLAVPLAVRGTRLTSLAGAVALGFGIGFAYFILVAFTRALGQATAIPPALAAWAPNAIFTLVGVYYLVEGD
jgi:lipopolysaccharide export system permease protein